MRVHTSAFPHYLIVSFLIVLEKRNGGRKRERRTDVILEEGFMYVFIPEFYFVALEKRFLFTI